MRISGKRQNLVNNKLYTLAFDKMVDTARTKKKSLSILWSVHRNGQKKHFTSAPKNQDRKSLPTGLQCNTGIFSRITEMHTTKKLYPSDTTADVISVSNVSSITVTAQSHNSKILTYEFPVNRTDVHNPNMTS